MRVLLAAVAMVLLAGCAGYSDRVGTMERMIATGHPERALRLLEEEDEQGRDALLTLLNRAILQRMKGDYAASTASLEAAKRLSEHFATLSVSEQAGALTVNDALRAYAGEPYERVFIHVFEALNYLQQDRLPDARVEALQLDLLLRQLPEDAPDAAGVARYLAGLIYESLHEWDDALIAYRKSYQAYSRAGGGVPLYLQRDLLRLTRQLGREAEWQDYRRRFGDAVAAGADAALAGGEVVVFLCAGLAPVKRDVVVPVYSGAGRLVSVALPYVETRRAAVAAARVGAAGATAPAEMMVDVNTLAVQALERNMPAITARAVARAVAKYQAAKKAEEDGGPLLGAAINIAGLVSERADTRSWSTLPNRIFMARLPLAPGRYDVTLSWRDDGEARRVFKGVTVTAGRKRFFGVHVVSVADLRPTGGPPPRTVIDLRLQGRRRGQ
ncbi:MAG TPA: hypothetical protein ENJ19_04645 [Gammaproteobacteria bacterium]|nr:hypothetical protein [Gammaproteobacteria bacterium]